MSEDSTGRQAVLMQIQSAFAGVVRGQGTSLYASTQIDNHLLPEDIVETAEACELDPGTNWEEIPGSWLTRFGANGGFCFMNPEGFRYYLPACMSLYVREPKEATRA